MTDHQKQVLNQVRNLLGEHFDGFVLAVSGTTEDGSGSFDDVLYDGGFAAALGLSQILSHSLEEEMLDSRSAWTGNVEEDDE